MANNAQPYGMATTHWPGLAKLVEELGELQQVLGKILMTGTTDHWDGDLTPRLTEELGDVIAAMTFFIDHNNLEHWRIGKRGNDKRDLFEQWAEGVEVPDQR